MNTLIITRTDAGRKLWFPYSPQGSRFSRTVRLPPPRLVQLVQKLVCRTVGHDWSAWRIETKDWFEYVDEPEPYAWHVCRRHCGAHQHCVDPEDMLKPVTGFGNTYE